MWKPKKGTIFYPVTVDWGENIPWQDWPGTQNVKVELPERTKREVTYTVSDVLRDCDPFYKAFTDHITHKIVEDTNEHYRDMSLYRDSITIIKLPENNRGIIFAAFVIKPEEENVDPDHCYECGKFVSVDNTICWSPEKGILCTMCESLRESRKVLRETRKDLCHNCGKDITTEQQMVNDTGEIFGSCCWRGI